MAVYNMRAHAGITTGHAAIVTANVYALVAQAAVGVGWNKLGIAPAGFAATVVGGRVRRIHPTTQIEFKAGFLMFDIPHTVQKWEGHAVAGGLRLDLQSVNNGWANWAVQTNGQNSATIATCLMRVDQSFSQNQLAQGLIRSATANPAALCELSQ